jgi:hypothetical protein
MPVRGHLGPVRRISPALRSELYPILTEPPTRSGGYDQKSVPRTTSGYSTPAPSQVMSAPTRCRGASRRHRDPRHAHPPAAVVPESVSGGPASAMGPAARHARKVMGRGHGQPNSFWMIIRGTRAEPRWRAPARRRGPVHGEAPGAGGCVSSGWGSDRSGRTATLPGAWGSPGPLRGPGPGSEGGVTAPRGSSRSARRRRRRSRSRHPPGRSRRSA